LTRVGLSSGAIGGLELPIPPATEQHAIASFLDRETSKIDSLVAEQRRLVELLKEKRQAVISHAVTKGLDPTVPMKPSGIPWLGDVPAHWEVQRIKHVIRSIEQGWSPQCENDPVQSQVQWGVLKVGCVNYGKFTAEENKALPDTLIPQPALTIRRGDLLISRANTLELVGSAAVAERDYPNLMLCDKLYRLRVDRNSMLPEFLCHFLTCEVAREPIELGASGASPSMKNIAQSVILEMWLASPDVDEQQRIIDAIRKQRAQISSLITEAERAITLLQERRTALISAAITGKIDVRATACEGANR
jgi:type I restriction enzyme S subunit